MGYSVEYASVVCHHVVGVQAALEGKSSKKGQSVTAYAIALAAALSVESPFMHVDSITVRLCPFLHVLSTANASLQLHKPLSCTPNCRKCLHTILDVLSAASNSAHNHKSPFFFMDNS